jgi:oxygen-independent coproporphyrinogen-3 oxidase
MASNEINYGVMPPIAAYIHVPFCARRCGYCNFTVASSRADLIDRYLAALESELALLVEPRPVTSLFIGGGTPTHLPPKQLWRLLAAVTSWFPPRASHDGSSAPSTGTLRRRESPSYRRSDGSGDPSYIGHEFSVEANPLDIDADRLSVLAEFGVNRLSLGVQSFDDRKLKFLERDHSGDDVRRALELARPAFPSVSIDLIFGIEDETVHRWQRDLAHACTLGIDHVSIYGLTIERGSTFFGRLAKREFELPDEETQRTMYETGIDTLTAAGFEHYEVSNFAQPGHRCRHNEVYWRCEEYFAAGPGASRYVDGRRETNHRSTSTYIKRIEQGESPLAEAEELDAEDRARERLVFGLRMIEGVDENRFTNETGFSIEQLAGDALSNLIDLGLLQRDGGVLTLTRDGLLVSDSIWSEFLCR